MYKIAKKNYRLIEEWIVFYFCEIQDVCWFISVSHINFSSKWPPISCPVSVMIYILLGQTCWVYYFQNIENVYIYWSGCYKHIFHNIIQQIYGTQTYFALQRLLLFIYRHIAGATTWVRNVFTARRSFRLTADTASVETTQFVISMDREAWSLDSLHCVYFTKNY